MAFRRRPQPKQPKDGSVWLDLRGKALRATEFGVSPTPSHPDVAGVVVDIPSSGAFVTIVALADGTTSMYTSTGGGVIGAGSHVEVVEACGRLLASVQAQLGLVRTPDDGELPQPGRVRFHVLTPSQLRRVDVPEDSFWGRTPHELMSVIAATQELVTALRRVSPNG